MFFLHDEESHYETEIYLQFQTVLLMAGFLLVHLFAWDHSDTRAEEEFSSVRLFNFFSNPENAINNVAVLVGHVSNYLET